MLAQNLQRKGAKTQSRKGQNGRSKIAKFRTLSFTENTCALEKSLSFASLRLCVFAVIFFSLSCGSKPTDLRTVVPADALVYLETNDLGKAVAAITENKSFQQLAKTQPDTSALNGIKLAVAVTGFQTSEQRVTDENSVLNFQPRFVAVAETNAWNYQALSFTENKFGEFINETYGGEVVLETTDKHGGKYFIWTAQDGRKTYALVRGSLIFFGNDESAIEKCLTVTRGEADSIAKNAKVPASPSESLATGYVSTDGVAQISNIAGVTLALAASEEGEVKSFIARVLPEILRNSVVDVTWTATKKEQGIEDNYDVKIDPEVAAVFSATFSPAGKFDPNVNWLYPADTASVTRYNLKDPQIAWRSVLLTTQKMTDSVSGNLIGAFSGSLFEPYGIEDSELFLSSVQPSIITIRFDDEGEKLVVIAGIKDLAKIKQSVAKEFEFSAKPKTANNSFFWETKDGELALALVLLNWVVIGDTESVKRCLEPGVNRYNFHKHPLVDQYSTSDAASVTVANDRLLAARIVDTLSERNAADASLVTYSLTETRFNHYGIERRVVSDFGLIGSIVEQLGKDN